MEAKRCDKGQGRWSHGVRDRCWASEDQEEEFKLE